MTTLAIIIFAGLLGLIPATIKASIVPPDKQRETFFTWWACGALLFIVVLPMALFDYSKYKSAQRQNG